MSDPQRPDETKAEYRARLQRESDPSADTANRARTAVSTPTPTYPHPGRIDDPGQPETDGQREARRASVGFVDGDPQAKPLVPVPPTVPALPALVSKFKVTRVSKSSTGDCCVTLTQQGSDGTTWIKSGITDNPHAPGGSLELHVGKVAETRFQLNQEYTIALTAKL